MTVRRTLVLATVLAASAGLAACERKPAPGAAVAETKAPADDGYLESPAVAASALEGAALVLSGSAEPGAEVRLASPTGQALTAAADAQGRWRIAMPSLQAPAVFGLSMKVGERQIQAQGYVLVDADGAATLLRAGAGAISLQPGAAPRITTFDYDRAGGSVISGLAPPEAAVTVRGDGLALGEGRADRQGRFSIPITRPLAPGQHRVQILGGGFADSATVEVQPAEPLSQGPFRSRRTAAGLRADWMTPGGGVQTTLILN